MLRLEKKNILITGGYGFIGSNLAKRLVKDNKIFILDNCCKVNSIQYTDLLHHPNVTLINGSILDYNLVSDIICDIDIIVHAAALLGVKKVLNEPLNTLQINYNGTEVLLRAAKKSKNLKRFIYLSSSEVFGSHAFGVNEDSLASLVDLSQNRWSYAISKLAAEQLCFGHFKEFQLPITIIRPFNVFGPTRIGDHAIINFVMSALHNKPVKINGNGMQIRAWCYIDDFINGLTSAIACQDAIGSDFNLGDNRNTITTYELARRIIDICRSKSEIISSDLLNGNAEIEIRVPDSTKASKIFGYKPVCDFNLALKDTITWYYDNFMK